MVFARTTPGAGSRGITAFLVPADRPGLTGSALDMLSPHPIGTLEFDGVPVTADDVLGEPDRGFHVAMNTLNLLRPSVGAFAVGMARAALDATVDHTARRTAFGGPLSDLQAVSHQVAEMATRTEAARLLVYAAAAAYDAGEGGVPRRAAMAKLYATETAQYVVDTAVQLHGARALRRATCWNTSTARSARRASTRVRARCSAPSSPRSCTRTPPQSRPRPNVTGPPPARRAPAAGRRADRARRPRTAGRGCPDDPGAARMSPSHRINPAELSPPTGFSHAVVATGGHLVFLAGQTALDPRGKVVGDTLPDQFAVALGNLLTALHAAGGAPADLTRVTVYATDVDDYRSLAPELGRIWRRLAGRDYPAMAVIGVAGSGTNRRWSRSTGSRCCREVNPARPPRDSRDRRQGTGFARRAGRVKRLGDISVLSAIYPGCPTVPTGPLAVIALIVAHFALAACAGPLVHRLGRRAFVVLATPRRPPPSGPSPAGTPPRPAARTPGPGSGSRTTASPWTCGSTPCPS